MRYDVVMQKYESAIDILPNSVRATRCTALGCRGRVTAQWPIGDEIVSFCEKHDPGADILQRSGPSESTVRGMIHRKLAERRAM